MPGLDRPMIVVKKSERSLELFDGGRLIRSYTIALGRTPVGDKEVEGDGKTPEGEFYIPVKNPKSKYHLGLGISYPNTEDAARGLSSRLIGPEEEAAIKEAIANRRMPPQKTKLGGEIYIHGGGNQSDWTRGCIAMANSDIEELFEAVGTGTPVTILE